MGRAMDVRITRVHHPITVLGPGRRVGVWFQGCTLACAGCMSRHTWNRDAGTVVDVGELAGIVLDALVDEDLDGLTISGGEPFQQPAALRELCERLRRQRPTIDILVYSGYSFDRLQRTDADTLALVDAVISGPFVASLSTTQPWRGSSNQVLNLLSQRATSRYADPVPDGSARLQVAADDAGLWVTGIPRRGDLERMRELLLGKGLVLEAVSWTT